MLIYIINKNFFNLFNSLQKYKLILTLIIILYSNNSRKICQRVRSIIL